MQLQRLRAAQRRGNRVVPPVLASVQAEHAAEQTVGQERRLPADQRGQSAAPRRQAEQARQDANQVKPEFSGLADELYVGDLARRGQQLRDVAYLYLDLRDLRWEADLAGRRLQPLAQVGHPLAPFHPAALVP